MPQRLTLIVSDQVYQALREIAAANEDTLSGTVSTSIKALSWIMRQRLDGFVVKAEREEKNKIIVKELVIS